MLRDLLGRPTGQHFDQYSDRRRDSRSGQFYRGVIVLVSLFLLTSCSESPSTVKLTYPGLSILAELGPTEIYTFDALPHTLKQRYKQAVADIVHLKEKNPDLTDIQSSTVLVRTALDEARAEIQQYQQGMLDDLQRQKASTEQAVSDAKAQIIAVSDDVKLHNEAIKPFKDRADQIQSEINRIHITLRKQRDEFIEEVRALSVKNKWHSEVNSYDAGSALNVPSHTVHYVTPVLHCIFPIGLEHLVEGGVINRLEINRTCVFLTYPYAWRHDKSLELGIMLIDNAYRFFEATARLGSQNGEHSTGLYLDQYRNALELRREKNAAIGKYGNAPTRLANAQHALFNAAIEARQLPEAIDRDIDLHKALSRQGFTALLSALQQEVMTILQEAKQFQLSVASIGADSPGLYSLTNDDAEHVIAINTHYDDYTGMRLLYIGSVSLNDSNEGLEYIPLKLKKSFNKLPLISQVVPPETAQSIPRLQQALAVASALAL